MEIDPVLLESKILIIDDDVNLGLTLEELLKDNDYRMVRYISDPREARDVFSEFQPDLIMLDIQMPHMDGFQVMEALSDLRAKSFVPILILTGQVDDDICVRALSAGANEFLGKPMNMTEALVRINNLLEIRRLHVRLESRMVLLEDTVRDRTGQLKKAFEDINQMHETVKQAYIETIYRLTRATEYKDEETANHVKRLSLYAQLMGRELGMNDTLVEMLLYASPMHDIGKIGIPDDILFKPSKLDPEEWEIMQRHTIIGHEILKDSDAPVLKLGAKIALTHHERWDGSGYPGGLKGEEIPVESRILALIDVYDSLRSRRHYKEAFDHEKSCKIILEGDGRVEPCHFDPELLKVFKRVHLEFDRIFNENAD